MTFESACRLVLSTLGALLATSISAHSGTNGPSFDCNKASQPDESAVCSSPSLSELDQLLAVGFQYIKKHNGKAPAQTLAREFLAKRKTCGANVDCVQSAYVDAMIAYQHADAPILVPGWAIRILPEVVQPLAPVARTSTVPAPTPTAPTSVVQATPAPSTQQAIQKPIANPNAKVLRMPDGGAVWVWKNAEAQSEGITLIQSGADSDLIAPLLACIVPSGVHATISDFGLMTSDVIVIDGSKAGCRGNVSSEYIHLSS